MKNQAEERKRDYQDLLDEVGSWVVPDIGGHWAGHSGVGRLEAARLLLDGGRGAEAAVAQVGEDQPRGPLWRPNRLGKSRHRGCWPLGAVPRTLEVRTEKEKFSNRVAMQCVVTCEKELFRYSA